MAIKPPAIDPSKIYLHLETIDGVHCLVDQDGRRVAGVRGLSVDMAYNEVGKYVLRGILCRPDIKDNDALHWKHVNMDRKCQSEA